MSEPLFIFINPSRFFGLLEDISADQNILKLFGTENEETEGINFIKNEVVYVHNDNNFTRDVLNVEKANLACAIFIPDDHDPINNFSPNKPFKILHHTTDEPHHLQTDLKNEKFYKGYGMRVEESDTFYGDLAKAFKKGSMVETIREIYEQIDTFNRELEEKLELLHKCLVPKNLEKIKGLTFLEKDFENFLSEIKKIRLSDDADSETTEPLLLSDEAIKKIPWDNPTYIQNLKDFRKMLLGT